MNNESGDRAHTRSQIEQAQATDALNWCVPCRRAVVREAVSYNRVVEAWINNLYTNRGRIVTWYMPPASGGESDPLPARTQARLDHAAANRFMNGLLALQRWKDSYFPITDGGESTDGAEISASPEIGNTIETTGRQFLVRLWKGPLRVLREREANRPAARRRADPLVPPDLTSNKEVRDAGTEFLMGDIIEFPFHKVLAACGESRFNGIEFNPQGSPFLGTTLKEDNDSPPSSATVHDNIMGMRLQLLLNCAMGAFSSLAHVFQGGAVARGASATAGGDTVRGRGLIYAASLGDPTEETAGQHWRVMTNRWGYYPPTNNPADAHLPNRTSIRYYPDHLPLTPGWSCSPCTLYVSYYLFNVYEYGYQSVDTEYGLSENNTLRRYYENHGRRQLAEQYDIPVDGTISNGVPGQQEQRNVADMFTDLNVLPLTYFFMSSGAERAGGHEIAVIKIYPPEHLMQGNVPPTSGFFTAYHPLSGAPYFENDALAEEGQIYIFESAGQLGGTAARRRCGSEPFKWQRVDNNHMYVHYQRRQNHLRITRDQIRVWRMRGGHRVTGGFVNKLYRVRPELLTEQYGNDALYKKIVIQHPNPRGPDTFRATNSILGDIDEMYGEWAVPFPVMDQAVGKYPRAGHVAAVYAPAAVSSS